MNARKLLLALFPVLLMLVLVLHVGVALGGAPGTARYDVPVIDVPGYPLRQPALARDNTMYVGNDTGCTYAYNSDGTIKWVYWSYSPVTTNAAVYYSPDNEHAQYNGRIYVGLEDGRVLALDPEGNLEWQIDYGMAINASPALAADGTIYVGREPSLLIAINPEDGSQKWVRALPGTWGIHDPVVGPDGTIYFADRELQYFYAVDSAGSVKWATHIVGGIHSPAAIGRDGTIYFGGGHSLHALWPNGNPKWHFYLGDTRLQATPVIGHEGTIYVSAQSLVAINPDGSWEWDFWYESERPRPISSAAVDSNGLIYFPAYDGHIYCVAPGGTFVWRYHAAEPESWLSASVIGSDGLLYSTEENRVRALYTGATGPFDGAWPMYRRDPACSARLDKYWYMMSDLKDLLGFVARADLSTRIKKTLVVKAKSAMQSLERGHIVPVKNKLGAFVHHVEALEGKKIPEELADAFIRHALRIMMMADGDVHELPQDSGTPRGKPSRPTPPKATTPVPSLLPDSPPQALSPPHSYGGP